MTTKPQEAASTSTLGAGQTGQNSLINEENAGIPRLHAHAPRPRLARLEAHSGSRGGDDPDDGDIGPAVHALVPAAGVRPVGFED